MNLLRYPDGEKRELRRWLLLSIALGAVLGALATQALGWHVQDRVQRDTAERQREHAQREALARQAKQARWEEQQHARRLQWQQQAQGVLAQQEQVGQIW